MIASPKSKELVTPPAKANEATKNPVEQALRQSAAWEPDYAPPADFAHFTRCALEKRARTTFPPVSRRPAPPAQWALALRGPLTAGLALGLVLWVGGSPSDLPVNQPSEMPREIVRPVAESKPNAPNRNPQTVKTVPLVQAQKTNAALVRAALADEAFVSGARFAARTSHSARSRRPKLRGANRTGEQLAARNAKQTDSAPLWKTETVERPAWGALIPATFACTTPADETVSGSAGDETETTLMPVVLDVALPETTNLAAATGPSSTGAPLPSTAP